MEEFARKNPWLGLESYKEGEILYGRDDDIRDLSQCILNDTDTLLYGKSGIGKSSILNAGILPAARRSGYLPILIRLSHKGEHPYLHQINQAIHNAILHSQTSDLGTDASSTNGESVPEDSNSLIREVVPCKNADAESLYEYFHRHLFYNTDGERVKLLIIFDQFEEIFTLQEDVQKKKNFFAHLADLLNDIMPDELQHKVDVSSETQEEIQVACEDDFENIFNDINLCFENHLPEYITDNDIHFVFTIREDFLSEFEYYSAAIPSLKQNRYGLRPINEEQASQIILRPVPGLIDKSVAKLIIEKITGKKDFKLDGVPEIEVDSAVLSLYLNRLFEAKDGKVITKELVEQKGGEIISEFYNDALSGISDSTIEYLENMLLNGQGRRDNITVYDAINDGNVSKQELDILCNRKKILRQFNYSGDLRIEYVHDILCPVVKEHKEERTLLRLHEEEKRKQEELQRQLLLEEEKKRKEIERKAEEEKKRLEEEARQIKEKNRKRLTGILVTILLLGMSIGGWYVLKYAPYSIYCGNFTIKNGWPIGLGVLDNNDNTIKETLIVHYRLTREGWLPPQWGGKPYTKVEVLSADGNLTNNILVETSIVGLLESELNDEKAREFANLQKKTAYWEYLPNDEIYSSVTRCIAYDTDKKELYSIQYYRDNTYVSNDNNKHVQWALFNNANGEKMIVTDDGVDRMRQTVRNGIVTGCLFFTELSTPQRNANGAYGYLYEVDDSTLLMKTQYSVDKFGTRIDSTVLKIYNYEFGRIKKTSSYEMYYYPDMIVYHYTHYDDTLLFDKKRTLRYGTYHSIGNEFSKIAFKYNEDGYPMLYQKYVDNKLVESRSYEYCQTNMVSGITIMADGIEYAEKYAYPDDATEILTLWQGDKKYSKLQVNEYSDTLYYHKRIKKSIADSAYIVEVTEYKDTSEQLIPATSGDYAKYSVYKDIHTGNVKLEYFYDAKEDIYKSEWYDYDEYGNRIARAVAGIDGKPVRCPNWDWQDMCYYKMAFLKHPDAHLFISANGINEFEEAAYIKEGEYIFDICERPAVKMEMDQTVDGVSYRTFGLSISQNNWTRIGNKKQAPYLHVLNRKGSIYNAVQISDPTIDKQVRLEDGDVISQLGSWHIYDSQALLEREWNSIYKSGGSITVLKKTDNDYKNIRFHIDSGEMGAEYHFMPLTEKEQERIKINL